MIVSDTAKVAASYYRERWTVLRDEALTLADKARTAPPLTARKLRNQSRLCDDYAVILHHAAWREEHPDEPDR